MPDEEATIGDQGASSVGTSVRDTPADEWSVRAGSMPWETVDDDAGSETPRSDVTITPENPYASPIHAPSGYPYANWWRRFGAFMIDGAVISGAWIGLWFLLGATFSAGRISYWLADLAGTAYLTILTAGARGQTPGMRATGIAIKRRDSGAELGYQKAVIRSVTMAALAAPGAVLFLVDCLFPLWQKDRQALHDLAARTVVVDVRHGITAEPVATAPTTRPRSASAVAPPSRAALQRVQRVFSSSLALLRRLPSRLWIAAGAGAVGLVVLIAGISMISAVLASMHSPATAATAYLEALSNGDVSGMLDNAGIIAPTRVSPDTNVLLSSADIRRELRASGNAIGHVSNVTVTGTTQTSNTASVLISYIADNAEHSVTYSLIRSEHTPSGWAVQISPSRLDIDVPTGQHQATLDGMGLRLDGQVAHVYLFPSIANIATAATSIWKPETTTIDTSGQVPDGDPQEVSLAAQLLPGASTAALQTVFDHVTSCIATNSLAPTNCPNADTPYSAGQGDTYSGITWTSYGDPSGNLSVVVDKSGGVSVTGSVKVVVTYTDTTSGSSFFGPASNQQTDGPTTVDFTYPLDWDGSSWVLGRISLTSPNGQGA